MRARFRTLAALLALTAFSASFAEQVSAGTCAPAEATRHEQGAPASHPPGEHGGMTMPAGPAEHPSAPADAECPLQGVAAGCALILSPAARGDAVAPAPAADARVAPRADPSLQLLLVSALFRPPQR